MMSLIRQCSTVCMLLQPYTYWSVYTVHVSVRMSAPCCWNEETYSQQLAMSSLLHITFFLKPQSVKLLAMLWYNDHKQIGPRSTWCNIIICGYFSFQIRTISATTSLVERFLLTVDEKLSVIISHCALFPFLCWIVQFWFCAIKQL